MNKIISKERFSEKVFKFEIEAPLIAKSRAVQVSLVYNWEEIPFR